MVLPSFKMPSLSSLSSLGLPKMSGGSNCAANAASVSGGGRRRRRRSQRGGTAHTAPAATAPAATAPAAALPAGLNTEAMKNLIGSLGSLIKGGGRTRRLKRRLGKARRHSAKSHSAGGGKRRKTRRTRKHRR
jgi:hypothetical protein